MVGVNNATQICYIAISYNNLYLLMIFFSIQERENKTENNLCKFVCIKNSLIYKGYVKKYLVTLAVAKYFF
jgi:hypothetical protein